VFAADAQADEPGWNPSKEVQPVEQPEHERNLVEHRLADDERGQHAVVNRLLHALNHAGRKHSAVLDLRQQRIDVTALRKRSGKDVRGRDGILDRKVDPHSADR
jgi:hypothetical protein